ncbi:MAG: hypothetical protein HYV28_09125 [Ignavibacteriales bacterium]|nr:hypothetical protein [Ignavibacteriales bacterium]
MSKYLGQLPVLPVKSLMQTIVFYKDILGFGDEWFWESKEAGISKDEMHLVFSQNEDFVSVLNNDTRCFELMWFVQDIEEVYQDYQQKEIPFELPLMVQPWGLKEFAFKDINGYRIRVAEHGISTEE